MKKTLICILLICLTASFCGCRQNKIEIGATFDDEKSEIIVVVDGKEYNRERFNLYFYNAQDEILKSLGYRESTKIPSDFWSRESSYGTMLDAAKAIAIDMLIDDAIEHQKAKEYGIELTVDELSGINNQISVLMQDKVSYAQFEYIGISSNELEKYYKEELIKTRFVSELIADGSIKIDEENVAETFMGEYAKYMQIYIPTIDVQTGKALSEEEIKSAQSTINDVYVQLGEGAEFEELMTKYSRDGYLYAYPDGYVISKEDTSELTNTVFSLDIEETTKPLKLEDGFYIIKRVVPNFDGMQEMNVVMSIQEKIAEPQLEKLIKKWRNEADIKIYEERLGDLVPTITNNEGMMNFG